MLGVMTSFSQLVNRKRRLTVQLRRVDIEWIAAAYNRRYSPSPLLSPYPNSKTRVITTAFLLIAAEWEQESVLETLFSKKAAAAR